MKRQSYFRSWVQEDRDRAGGYTYPILDQFGDYSISIFSPPENEEDYNWLRDLLHDPKTLMSYVDDFKTVVIRGQFTLEDMGLTVLTTPSGTGKTVKRAKTLARPFRIHTMLPEGMRVKFVDGGPELDGAFVVSREIYTAAVNNLQIPGWHPVQRAGLIRAMDRQRVHNFRGVGHMIDADTGEDVLGFAKGNVIISDSLPDGVDIMLTRDNFKSEFVAAGTSKAWALFEPQGPKDAWEDQQTVVNQPFLLSVPEARKRMKEVSNEYLDHLISGGVLNDIEELSKAEFHKDYAYDSDTFGRLLRWYANKWALHGMSYTLSPWLTERLGISFMKSFSIDDPHKIRIPIPGGMRAQVVTEALVRLAGYDISVAPGDITWFKPLGVAVVNDVHWIHQIVPTHGGCDLDDFFVLRRNGDKCIITRSPNARGEYTEFDSVIQWWPGSEKARPLTRKMRPTQILDALGSGETSYIPLPSELSEVTQESMRPYTVQDTMASIDDMLTVEGGYGQYELAVRAYNSLSLAKHPDVQIASEDAVDAFTQGGTAEDRNFILSDRERIIEEIVSTGKAVDTLIVRRLGTEDRIPEDTEGPLVRMKRVQMEADKEFMSKLRNFTLDIEVPDFLRTLGNNFLLPQATTVLRESRRAMWQADQRGMDIRDAQEYGITLTNPLNGETIYQFAGIITLLDGIEDIHHRHQFALAFWYACLTVSTKRGKITDQPVFGTKVLDYVLDALVYFGVAQVPYMDDEGHVVREYRAFFDTSSNTWTLTCVNCGTEYRGVGEQGLRAFHVHDGLCKNCRD